MEGPSEPIFLLFMCRLRVLEIYVDPCSAIMSDFGFLSFVIRSLRVSLTFPATLEHIKFDIVFKFSTNNLDYPGDWFMVIYVTPISGAISNPLSLIQPVHGYKESTLTLNTPF